VIIIAIAVLLGGFVTYVSRQRRADRAIGWIAFAGAAIVIVAAVVVIVGVGGGGEPGATPKVWFSAPLDGTKVAGPVTLRLASEHLVIEPAGQPRTGAGHFHIIVDGPCMTPGQIIPADATHIHLGKGQAETALDLVAGEHKLCLQAGSGSHVALSATNQITVTVAR